LQQHAGHPENAVYGLDRAEKRVAGPTPDRENGEAVDAYTFSLRRRQPAVMSRARSKHQVTKLEGSGMTAVGPAKPSDTPSRRC
jgi:hypothetical protein